MRQDSVRWVSQGSVRTSVCWDRHMKHRAGAFRDDKRELIVMG